MILLDPSIDAPKEQHNTCQMRSWYGIHPVRAEMHGLDSKPAESHCSFEGLQTHRSQDFLWPMQNRHAKIVLKSLKPGAKTKKNRVSK